MWILGRWVLLVVGVLLVNFDLAVRQGEFALPVSVTLEGFRDSEAANVRLRAFYVGSHQAKLVRPIRPGYWECPPRCILEFSPQFLDGSPDADGIVRIDIGAESFRVPVSDLATDGANYWLPDNVVVGDAPGFAMCRNWPGMWAFLTYYLARTAPGLTTILLFALTLAIGRREPFRNRFPAILGLEETLAPTEGVSTSTGTAWNLVGWLALIGGFTILEFLQPYYFTQDDVLAGDLPAILLGLRSLWDGAYPVWHPYVFMGAPLVITYPPHVLAYAIARHGLGNEFATMEVFAALHLLVGFVAMRHLCRLIGMRALTANLSALLFVFAGCILIMGRSWHSFICNAVWLPLIGIAIQRFRQGPVGWKWVMGVGLVLGLSYHAGFPQITAILGIVLVLGLACVAIGDRLPLRRVAVALPAVLLGIGMAAPALLYHMEMTGGVVERFVPEESGVYDHLHGALLPYPLVETGLPTSWGSFDVEKMGHFYFFGGIFALLFAFQAFCFWICCPTWRAWSHYWWVPCGIVALLMTLGEPAFLWKGAAYLPLSKLFLRYSFRFYPWLAFCAILSGGLILDRILATLPQRRFWEFSAAAGLLCVLAYHLMMCTTSFYSYGFQPFPPLPPEFEAVIHPYEDKQFFGEKNSRRIASWHNLRATSPDLYASLPLNMPDYYLVPSIFGYDPLVEGQPRAVEVFKRLEKDPLQACKIYGVGLHIFSHGDSPPHSPNKRFWDVEYEVHREPAYRKLLKANLTLLAKFHDDTTLKELPGVDPLVFVTSRPDRALPIHLHCRGADIDVSGLRAGEDVTINFLWYPHMSLSLDGEAAPIEKDEWLRITTTLPRSGSTLSLRYEPPWQKTAAIGGIVCLAALLLAWLTIRANRPS
jgi:hypothetical protein